MSTLPGAAVIQPLASPYSGAPASSASYLGGPYREARRPASSEGRGALNISTEGCQCAASSASYPQRPHPAAALQALERQLDIEAAGPDIRLPDIEAGYPDIEAGYPDIEAGYPDIEAGYPDIEAGYPDIEAGYPDIEAGYPDIEAGYRGREAGSQALQDTRLRVPDIRHPRQISTRRSRTLDRLRYQQKLR